MPRVMPAARLTDLDRIIGAVLSEVATVGCAIGVVQNGALIYTRNVGYADVAATAPVTSETAFRIGSVSKTFTGIGIMQLRDNGLLDLDDPVAGHLRTFQWHDLPGETPATIRQL